MVQELNKIKIFALNIWKQFIDVSIKIKLIGLTILTSLFLGFIILYFMSSFYNREISHDAQYMSMVIGRHISEDSMNFIAGGNYNKLNILLKNEVKNNKNILYIFYLNNRGAVTAHAFHKGFTLISWVIF